MKKLIYIIIALTVLTAALTACGKEEDNNMSTESSFVESSSVAESVEPSSQESVEDASLEASSVAVESSAAEESSAEESVPKKEIEFLDGHKLVVFGDSITALGTWGRSAAEQLNMYFFNGAMGGITTAQGLERFDAYVASRSPDFVTLLFGMNDLIMTSPNTPRLTPEQFGENLKKLVQKTVECGAIPILLTTNPLNPNVFFSAQGQDSSWYSEVGTPLEWLDVYNEVTRSVASETETFLIDMRAACEGVSYNQLLTDGIHLATRGNTIFTDTLVSWFNANYASDPSAERVSEADTYEYITASGEKASLVPFATEDWYTVDKTKMLFRATETSIRICNTDSKWPEAHAIPESPISISVKDGKLYYDITIAGAGASIVLYFDGATPSAFTDGQYIAINKVMGNIESFTGDLLPNQKLTGSVSLSELGIPSGVIKDGKVLITGIKIFVAGTAYQYITIRELSVGIE